jgi:hypothetical protein
MPAYPKNVRYWGVDRKSPWSGKTDANDPKRTLSRRACSRSVALFSFAGLL